MTDRELLQQALDALESWQKTCLDCGRSSEELGMATKPLQAIRTRLAQPKKEWVGLTDEEIRNEAKNHVFDESFFSGAVWARGQIMGKNNE
jgi:hypothetical protein